MKMRNMKVRLPSFLLTIAMVLGMMPVSAFVLLLPFTEASNFSAAVMRGTEGLNQAVIMAYYISGFPMDLIHGFATAIFLLIAAEPMLEKLDRIKTKYGLVE